MEDYAPIFWVLLTVGIMAYNAISHARKQGAKPENTPWENPAPQEADPLDDAPEVPELGEGWKPFGTDKPGTDQQWTPFGTGKSGADQQWKPFGTDKPTPGKEQRSFSPQAQPATVQPAAIEEVFGDECQSLEEIPEQEYESLEQTDSSAAGSRVESMRAAGSAAVASSLQIRQESQMRSRNISSEESIEEHDLTNSSAENTHNKDKEFDLRQAVIYAEILKPKFDE